MPDNSYPTHHPKIVFITGATGGFGEAFTKRFDAIGAKLILHGRNQEKLETLAATLSSDCHLVTFDLKDRDGIEKAIESIPDAFKQIDLLINNAGGAFGLDKFQDASMDDLLDMIEMNNTSLIQISRLVLPQMVAATRGHIINIGSISGNWPYPGGHVYCAVKAFVQKFSLALRSDLISTNVRVSNIEPGMAETPFSLNRFKGDSDKAAAVYAKTTPLTADDIAETVFWTATLPPHVNINTLEVMSTKQSLSAPHVERNG